MTRSRNIVHQYFKKQFEEATIFVKVNPLLFNGTEITVLKDGTREIRELDFDEEIFDDLQADGFEPASPLEFNLYLSGLAK